MTEQKNQSGINPVNFNREAEELQVLLEISRSLHEACNLSDMIYNIIKKVQVILDAEAVSIILPDERNEEFLISWSENAVPDYAAKLRKFRFPMDKGIVGRVFRNCKAELIPDVQKEACHYKVVDDFTGFQTKSMLAAPLQGKSSVIGVIEVMNKRRGRFTEKDLDFLVTLSCIVGLALDNARMYAALERAYKELQIIDKAKDNLIELTQEENIRLRSEVEARYRFEQIKGNSDAMLMVLRLCEKAIESDITVLIKGETGTGKELVARCIHYNGRRKDKPFVTQNCAAVPETLLASELFGYKKGAFTGANRDRKGLFELAHGGTVFLDEVGEMSPAMQASLLRVLQEGEIKPVGAEQVHKVDVRVISATNRSLEEDVREGKFRKDLYFRLSVFPIELPPLRRRHGDIPLLASVFLQEFSVKNHKTIKGIAPRAMDYLAKYPFPGNVRELQNEMERAVAIAEDGQYIDVRHLSQKICSEVGEQTPPYMLQGALKEMVETLEKAALKEALAKHAGNKTRAAEELGLSRFGLMKKMQRYGL